MLGRLLHCLQKEIRPVALLSRLLHCLQKEIRPVALLSRLLHCLQKESRPVALLSRLLRCLFLVTVLITSQRVSESESIGVYTAQHCNTSASGVERAD